MKRVVIILLTLIITLITPPTLAQNRVLSLDGDGDYVEVADSEALNTINSQVMMEAWIKPTAFPSEQIAIVHKADERTPNSRYGTYALHLNSAGFIHLASGGRESMYLNSPPGSIALNTWYHVTGVINATNGVMRIFLNGAEVASGAFGKDIYMSALPLSIGWTQEAGCGAFAGQIDEVRIWDTARTPEAIRATMHTTLSGKETGLVGYWRFDLGKNITLDSSQSHADGKLYGDAHGVEVGTEGLPPLPKPGELLIPTVVSGSITAENGNPIQSANVRLEQDGEEITQTQSDADGNYHLVISEKVDLRRGSFDLFATKNELGDLRLGIRLRLGLSAKRIETNGESRTLNLTLTEAISISGKLMMLDDTTPHVAVPVQALRNGEVIEGALSDESGKYRFVNLKPGRYQVRCYIPGEYVYYGEGKDTPVADASQATTLHVERGKIRKDIDFRFAPFKKGRWKHFETSDGLASMAINTIYQDPDGILWFGTGSFNIAGNGASRYDGKTFTTFTQTLGEFGYDGLANYSVLAIHQDSDGIMWFGTGKYDDGNGVFRYDGKDFVNFTTDDGLVDNTVFAIHRGPSGSLWFGTEGGVSRYDGKSFQNFTVKDGLASNYVYAIHQASDGVLWFGTSGGVSRAVYPELMGRDGKQFLSFTTKDGLVNNRVYAIYQDPDGIMWFGTSNGVSRYDGKGFLNFTTKDGLSFQSVEAIHRTPDGVMWFGTGLGGVCRYDEQTFTTFTTDDGLLDNYVQDSLCESDGTLWIATGDGVSRYDGKQFLNFTTKDGLVPGPVSIIHRDSDGTLWFGTGGFSNYFDGGVSRAVYPFGGKEFVNFTTKNGLASNRIYDIHRDSNGILWFATGGGISRYDGKEFVNFTTKDGLVHNIIRSIHSEPHGVIWFGTDGLCRYNGKEFVHFTTEDGLAYNCVQAIHQDLNGVLWSGTRGGISCYEIPPLEKGEKGGFVSFTSKTGLVCNWIEAIHQDQDGILWFGTFGGGVYGYDGAAWTSLDEQCGLADNDVFSIEGDVDGTLWFSTGSGGLVHYRRSKNRPGIQLVSVKIVDKDYTELQSIPPITAGTRVTIEYNAIDFKTLPERRQYRTRITNYELRINLR